MDYYSGICNIVHNRNCGEGVNDHAAGWRHSNCASQNSVISHLDSHLRRGRKAGSLCHIQHGYPSPITVATANRFPPPLFLPTILTSPSTFTHAGHPPSSSPFPTTTIPAALLSQAGPPSLRHYCYQDGRSRHSVRQDRGCWHRRHRRSQAGIRWFVDCRVHGSAEFNPRIVKAQYVLQNPNQELICLSAYSHPLCHDARGWRYPDPRHLQG